MAQHEPQVLLLEGAGGSPPANHRRKQAVPAHLPGFGPPLVLLESLMEQEPAAAAEETEAEQGQAACAVSC